jgi:hypothetical protein
LAGVQHAVWHSHSQSVQLLHSMGSQTLDSLQFLDALCEGNYFLHFAGAHQLMLSYLRSRARLSSHA